MIIYRTRLILSLRRCGISFNNFFMMLHTFSHKEEIFWPTRLDLLVLFKVHIILDKYMYELFSKTQPFSNLTIHNFSSQRATQ